MKTTVLTRKELYDLVWATPRTKLAATLRVSDVAIGKACARHDVPMPPRGHWAKAEKQRQNKRALPTLKAGVTDHIEFTEAPARSSVSSADIGVPDSVPIEVQPTLTKPHALVRATLARVKAAKEFSGKLELFGPDVLNLRVYATGVDRGLRIFDAIIKATETIGCSWSVVEKKTVLTYRRQEVQVSLRQILKKGPPPPPPPSKVVRGRTEPNWDAMFLPTYTWEPTGAFEFEIETYVPGGARRKWRGTETKPLESKLSDLVRSLPVAATLSAAHRQELEDRANASEARHQRMIAAVVERERLRLLRAKLVGAATQFTEAQAIRHLCNELEKRLGVAGEAAPSGTTAWIQWARAEADSHDPTLGGLSALLDKTVVVPPEIKNSVRRQLGYYEEECDPCQFHLSFGPSAPRRSVSSWAWRRAPCWKSSRAGQTSQCEYPCGRLPG